MRVCVQMELKIEFAIFQYVSLVGSAGIAQKHSL